MFNQTRVTQFILRGFSDIPEWRLVVVLFFSWVYAFALLGNISVIIAVVRDSRLHSPLYFFLKNLCFVDLSYTSVTIPKALETTLQGSGVISYFECVTQFYIFFTLGSTECFLLTAMAYDRCMAIYRPLLYGAILSPKTFLLVTLWVLTVFHAMLHTLLMARLCFCAENVIPHFFCDMSALLKLSCSDTHVNELVIFITAGLILLIPFVLILLSYGHIVSSILKVPSARGIHKAFSTCGSRLSVVSLFYGTVIGLYLCPSANNSTVKDTVITLMYTVVTPMLNPFIYSLRNRDMKGAIGRIFKRKIILAW
ncbi:olfactory receptor 1E1-like [Marmota marmota marmota]|uniref:olfactory receptor 1E1-like n=1 Tax=Marmota marmota marmota TaxID=9994 RepID=UPI002093C8EF|nr:olfactory receptor 1E1-like [Marmota marmota marmota]